jgi:hypothetical protein
MQTVEDFIADIKAHPEKLKQEETLAQAKTYFEAISQAVQHLWNNIEEWCSDQGITTDQLLEAIEKRKTEREGKLKEAGIDAPANFWLNR